MNSITGITACGAQRGLSHYGMSKAAVTGLTVNAAIEYLPERIRVNAVAPTGIGIVENIN